MHEGLVPSAADATLHLVTPLFTTKGQDMHAVIGPDVNDSYKPEPTCGRGSRVEVVAVVPHVGTTGLSNVGCRQAYTVHNAHQILLM